MAHASYSTQRKSLPNMFVSLARTNAGGWGVESLFMHSLQPASAPEQKGRATCTEDGTDGWWARPGSTDISTLLPTHIELLVRFTCPHGWLWAEPIISKSRSSRTDQECSRLKACALRCKWFIMAFFRLCWWEESFFIDEKSYIFFSGRTQLCSLPPFNNAQFIRLNWWAW